MKISTPIYIYIFFFIKNNNDNDFKYNDNNNNNNDNNSNLHLTKNSVWITITEVNTVLKPTLSELKTKKTHIINQR